MEEPDSTGVNHTTIAAVDILGRAVSYTDEAGTISETDYDSVGRPVTSWRSLLIPGAPPTREPRVKITSTVYRLANTVDSTTEYLTNLTTGSTTNVTYDAVGRLSTVTRPVSTYGLVDTNAYDSWGRLASLTHAVNGTSIWSDTLGYSAAGKITHDQATNETRDYSFDAAGRLTQTSIGTTPTRFYSYDKNTNRCDAGAATGCDGTSSGALRYDNTDRIVSSPAGSGYVYDAAGNMTTVPQTGGVNVTITYDTNNHATVINDGTNTTTEVLTPSSRVLRHTVTRNSDSSVLEDLAYGYSGPDDSPDWTRPWAGGPVTTYLGDRTITQTTSSTAGTPEYWLSNPHGDLVGTTTSSGVFTANPTVDEFGVSSGAVPANRLGWLGSKQRYSTQDGIVRMGQRLYDPGAGRFSQSDPVEGGSANDYDYVNADPIAGQDLSGTWAGPDQCSRRSYKKYNSSDCKFFRSHGFHKPKHDKDGGVLGWLYDHVKVGVSICAGLCVNLGFQGGHWSASVGNLGSVGTTFQVGIASRKACKRYSRSVSWGAAYVGGAYLGTGLDKKGRDRWSDFEAGPMFGKGFSVGSTLASWTSGC